MNLKNNLNELYIKKNPINDKNNNFSLEKNKEKNLNHFISNKKGKKIIKPNLNNNNKIKLLENKKKNLKIN